MKIHNEKIILFLLYFTICTVISLFQLIQMSLTEVSFDWINYWFKVGLNCIIQLAIFVIGFPEAKKTAAEQEDFKHAAQLFRSKIEDLNKNGLNSSFRKHCEVFNINSLYKAIEEIIVIECGLDFSYFYKSKKELREELKAKKISFSIYLKLMKCKKLKVKYSYVNANKILLGSISKKNVNYDYNESRDALFIILRKIIMIFLIQLAVCANFYAEISINLNTIFNALSSFMTALMAIVFARKAGFMVIGNRKNIFIRWSDFIDEMKSKPLKEEDKKELFVHASYTPKEEQK